MENMTDRRRVAEQYEDDEKLSIRLRLHAKHSTSKISLQEWFFTQYDLSGPCRVLELGCGNGAQWVGRIGRLPSGSLLVLSDLSRGMVETVQAKFRRQNFLAMRADIQDLPFADESFDRVIANHMLYHVPNLPRAFSEVRRVLAPGGTFYAATNGTGGMRPWLHENLKKFNPRIDLYTTEPAFTLQNGAALLQPYFSKVRLVEFEDSLRITETQDLVDWICSSLTTADGSEEDFKGLYDYFEAIRRREGAIDIPKEAGMFIAVK